MPLKWNRKVLLAKIETVYGTDAAPTGAANAVLATNVQLSPMEGQDVSRELELATLGPQGTVPVEVHAKLSFEVELAPSGTAGTAPAWGPLLRACAVAETIAAGVSVTYNPVSLNHESATLHFWVENTKYALVGARGTATIKIEAQKVPKIAFTFTGLFTAPAETAQATPTLTAWQKPLVATKANTPVFTLNGVALVLRSLELDLANEVATRFLIGSESVLITQKSEKIAATVEAVLLTTLNPYALALAQTAVPVVLTHGVGAGKIATLNAPLAQIQRPSGVAQQQGIVEWPLNLVPQVNAGNDQWTLALT
jgi:hypothetical protein